MEKDSTKSAGFLVRRKGVIFIKQSCTMGLIPRKKPLNIHCIYFQVKILNIKLLLDFKIYFWVFHTHKIYISNSFLFYFTFWDLIFSGIFKQVKLISVPLLLFLKLFLISTRKRCLGPPWDESMSFLFVVEDNISCTLYWLICSWYYYGPTGHPPPKIRPLSGSGYETLSKILKIK